MESAGSGLIAGINAARLALGQEPLALPLETMLGSLAHYITAADPEALPADERQLRPLAALGERIRDKDGAEEAHSRRALERSEAWREAKGVVPVAP